VRFAGRHLTRAVIGLVAFVVAVNLVWWVAPTLGDPGVYRPLFAILVVVVASAAWRRMRD
jgi:hypothetical protein